MGFRTARICAFCELPVRAGGDHRHPGYGIVEHADPHTGSDPRVLHRFCGRMAKVHLPDDGSHCGLTLRRAWLGWATDQFTAGSTAAGGVRGRGMSRHFGAKHYERLGLHPDKLRNPALFQKYWGVRKMRCASHAIHYYAGR